MKRDRIATEARHFLSPKSYVTKDGREILYADDWKVRKQELWIRAGGRCENEWTFGCDIGAPMTRCRNEAADPHHVIPRSKGRNDVLENLVALCRACHDQLDRRKPRWTKRESVTK